MDNDRLLTELLAFLQARLAEGGLTYGDAVRLEELHDVMSSLVANALGKPKTGDVETPVLPEPPKDGSP